MTWLKRPKCAVFAVRECRNVPEFLVGSAFSYDSGIEWMDLIYIRSNAIDLRQDSGAINIVWIRTEFPHKLGMLAGVND